MIINAYIYATASDFSIETKWKEKDSLKIVNPLIFANTNIGKFSLNMYVGAAYMVFTKHLSENFRSSIGGIMSLDAYNIWNNLSVSISLMGGDGIARQDIHINGESTLKKDSNILFSSYGLSIGYSVVNLLKFRLTPAIGFMLSNSKTQIEKPNNIFEQLKTGITPSGLLSLNLAYRFVNVYPKYIGSSLCVTINTRAIYILPAVKKKNLPYYGHICYITLGICLDMFQRY